MPPTRIALVWLLVASGLPAQSDDVELGRRLRDLNIEGVRLYAQGAYAEAADVFERAVDLAHRSAIEPPPTLVLNHARALIGRGSNEMRSGRLDAAERSLRAARSMAPREPLAHTWLGILSLERRRNAEARDHLNEALQLDPGSALAHEYMGVFNYRMELLERALDSWQRAVELDAARAAGLQPLLEKVERELAVEATMRSDASAHFLVKYGAEEGRTVARCVLDWLEEAWHELGALLRSHPSEPLTVILYTDRDFELATGSHPWVAGLFDGKIRVPVRNFRARRNEIRETLRHEYTHFLIDGIAVRVPVWLNEGLAQIGEGRTARHVNGLLAAAKRRGSLRPLSELAASFATIADQGDARLAYAQSLSFTAYLAERFGTARLEELLRDLGPRADFELAFAGVFNRSLAELEESWRRSI